MPVECVEILDDGEGESGPPIPILSLTPGSSAAEHAEAASRRLGDSEIVASGFELDACDFHGESRVIEVRGLAGDTGPRRFRVRCEVRRFYRAEPEGI